MKRLAWSDKTLATIELPAGPMRIRSSFGSGLARRATDPPDTFWGVGDRGPNLKVRTLVERYGLEPMRRLDAGPGAKVMPRVDLGPAIARLRLAGDRIELVESFRLRDGRGEPASGLPVPGGEHARREPAFDLDGRELAPDPAGFDTEGIAASADGGFWIGDEFGPSLVRVDAAGRIAERLVPESAGFDAPGFVVRPTLPEIAARRHLNRGFEALASSPDGAALYLAFQSPLAHPDVAAHRAARHVRIWRFDPASGRVAAQFLYPLDPPHLFARDRAAGPVDRHDVKLSELAWLGPDRLLVLERVTRSSRIYRVTLDSALQLPPGHLDAATRPTIEEMSAAGALDAPVLAKQLLFDSDGFAGFPPDLEGMVVIAPDALLVVTDNDFGVEGAATQFRRIVFDAPLLG